MPLFRRFAKFLAAVFRFLAEALSVPEPPFPGAFRDIVSEYLRERPDFPLRSVVVAHPYCPRFASHLKRFKYRSDRSASRRFESAIGKLAEHARAHLPRDAIVTYPPSPFFRTLSRGYDHTAVLAAEFAKRSWFPLVRMFRVPWFRARQAWLSKESRLSNVSRSYRLSPLAKACSGRAVAFFDDVVSTWSTAVACALELRSNGNPDVRWYFLASPSISFPEEIRRQQLT